MGTGDASAFRWSASVACAPNATEHGTVDPLAVPARRGVVVFRAEDASAVTVAVTGDARALVRRKLAPTDAGAPRGPEADLRPIVRRVDVVSAGSMFEAELLFLEIARAEMPRLYRAAADRWQAWCVRLDPEAPAPTWRKTALREMDQGERDPGTLIGPMRDKDAAGRFGAGLDDAFELCRYPRELAKAPRGTPCAYKEMGRCPAACDGSEPMEAYRARARLAVDLDAPGRARAAEEAEAEMRAAADRHDFERAASCKAQADRLRALDGPAWTWADRLDRLGVVALIPSEREGWARLLAVSCAGWRAIADVEAPGPRAGWEVGPARALLDAAREACAWISARPTGPVADDAADALGLISGYLYARPKLRRGGFVRVAPGARPAEAWATALRKAARAAARGEDDHDPPGLDRELASV